MKITRWVGVALVATLLLGACGDDDSTTQAGSGGENKAYCKLAAQLDDQNGPPTQEQFEELERVAPEEIAEEVSFVVDAFEEKGVDAFMESEVRDRFDVIEPWEKENCPGADQDDDEEEASAQEPDPDATQVQVTATDFAFSIQGDVPAGKVAFVLRNEGDEPHHMSIVRFKDGTTLEEAQKAVAGGLSGIQPLMDEEVGQSSDAAAGETAVVNADLKPGLYGMACFVETEDEVHFKKGMRVAFEVR